MNQHAPIPPRPTRESVGNTSSILEQSIAATRQTFDPDAWHVMQQRDNDLIEQELLNGAGSNKFVYSFHNGTENVSGVSVIGARHVAATYGGIKHKLLSSMSKMGGMVTFLTYPQQGIPMGMNCVVLPELANEPDFYTVVIEITDIKTGNVIQVEATESRWGKKKGGGEYEKLHYKTIAQSKGFRNGVLDIIPQDIVIAWKQKMLALGNSDTITLDVLKEKRAGVIQYAAKNAVSIDRMALETLMLAQIEGLAEAARAALRIVAGGAPGGNPWDQLGGNGAGAAGAANKGGQAGAGGKTQVMRTGGQQAGQNKPQGQGNAPQGNGGNGGAQGGPPPGHPAYSSPEDEQGAQTTQGQPSGQQAGQQAQNQPTTQATAQPRLHRLISADGEVLIQDVPILEWAKEFADHLKEVPADMINAFGEHNWDSILEAIDDPDAKGIMKDVGYHNDPEPADGDGQVGNNEENAATAAKAIPDAAEMLITMPAGRINEAEITMLFRNALAAVETPEWMAAWMDANQAMLNGLETRVKLLAYKEIAKRKKELGIQV